MSRSVWSFRLPFAGARVGPGETPMTTTNSQGQKSFPRECTDGSSDVLLGRYTSFLCLGGGKQDDDLPGWLAGVEAREEDE